GARPKDLVPVGDTIPLVQERPRVAFVRTEFLGVLKGPSERSERRERASRIAEKIAGDHGGRWSDYYHTLFTLIMAEVSRRREAAIAALTRPQSASPAHAEPSPPAVRSAPPPGPSPAPAAPEQPT